MHCQRSTNLSSSHLLHRPTTPFAKRNMQKNKITPCSSICRTETCSPNSHCYTK
ncbi:hypothetical protein VFPPC_15572 [Pochonia chlamydosporia 170]|uniref:Uncharacterized protein n=1 Tax=Pochonia chlamydosporia 170 TaxID=1380566 RepID=A0A179FZ51_METCM|nr:hypothetical protein VFPPC_15572 [Pochonia chlamydosporia 170]OAQ70391.1 hypothetical protein VFPPC_15572 [Pochonia chlamydosporia 170]